MDKRCFSCFLNTYKNLFKKFNIDNSSIESFLNDFTIITNQENLISPEIQRQLNIVFCNIINNKDPFYEEKQISNSLAKNLYKLWKEKIISTNNSFNIALRLSIAGNIMDYGASNSYNIEKTIDRVLKSDFAIDYSNELKNRIQNSKTILYLGDNAGEIVFDKLFLEAFNHQNVYYAVKSAPVLNDITIDDAYDVGINTVAKLISNGYDAPSTILEKCSEEFINVFRNADLIISKGQGNLEGLLQEKDSRIYFLLMIKCDVIADLLNVKKGDFVVYNNNITPNIT
jgi:damage-control phosphatase, subfamily I